MKKADLVKLAEPTPDKEKKSRSIRGRSVDYVDARFVQDRLDAVCGIGGWQCSFREVGYGFVCRIEIWIDELSQWIGKEDGGQQDPTYASGSTTVIVSDPENDYKGGLSDAFKRAGVQWGIGRDLYREPERPIASASPATSRPAPAPVSSSPALSVTEEIVTPTVSVGNAPGEPGCITEEEFEKLNRFTAAKGMALDKESFKELWSWARKAHGWSRGTFDFQNTKTWDFSTFNLPAEAYEVLKAKALELKARDEEPF
jgi:hypothetical protein